MTISVETRVLVYKATVKTLNGCKCPKVAWMLFHEMQRQYEALIERIYPGASQGR